MNQPQNGDDGNGATIRAMAGAEKPAGEATGADATVMEAVSGFLHRNASALLSLGGGLLIASAVALTMNIPLGLGEFGLFLVIASGSHDLRSWSHPLMIVVFGVLAVRIGDAAFTSSPNLSWSNTIVLCVVVLSVLIFSCTLVKQTGSRYPD